MKSKKRKIDLVVISDVHLGTYGAHARELHQYLQSIKPGTLILNGDIIDIWQFSKRYWPTYHMKVVKDIINMAAKGTAVYYITGNHDETMRKFSGLRIGTIEIVNKLELILDGTKTWFFHGDVFDVVMQHSRWLEKIGAKGYDFLILLNVFVNYVSKLLGRKKVSISTRVKENVKNAVKFIGNFEQTAAKLAIRNGFKAIVCGHIHKPEIKEIQVENSSIVYMNSGDWVENLTALEYQHGVWNLYRYNSDMYATDETETEENSKMNIMDMANRDVFKMVVKEFQL